MALSPIIEGTVNIQERHAQIYKDNVCVSTEALNGEKLPKRESTKVIRAKADNNTKRIQY